MPAQKLTKARLAQIIFMLALLIIAFVWRTMSYQSLQTINCSGKEICEFTIESTKIVIKRINGQIKVQTDENSTLKIDLDQNASDAYAVSGTMALDIKESTPQVKIRDSNNTLVALITL